MSGETASDIEAQLLADIAARLGVEARGIDPAARFTELGLDSAAVQAMIVAIGERLGRSLPPTIAWDWPTAAELARHLAQDGAAAERRTASTPQAARARRAASALDEPIAIVGMACRLPGAASLDAYWRLLCDGIDAVREVPAERWDVDAVFDRDASAPGAMSTRWGGFLDDVRGFDPQFFGISPREAVLMDPQQRLMLELSHLALEDAGVAPASLRGSRSAVFSGALWSDYAQLLARRLDAIGQHSATGQEMSIIPARISYNLGLRGPSVGVQTACSSSLVAVHLAVQSLRAGECSLALAGGVNLVLIPHSTVAMTKFGAMSPTGRSRAFDDRADGYVRGEGGGLVVLKRLADALADGDRIYCLVRGSAVNNDGYSNGLTAPNPVAQEEVLEDAYAAAGVASEDVDYVEAHGTGTPLGDPIEAAALGRVLGHGRPADRPLLIGSVKSNIGHLEAAAGIAGLIKTALALHHRVIPRSLHFEVPSRHIAFADLGIRVVERNAPWPARERPRLAGVSSFGFGGTNCHVVVAEPPVVPPVLVALAAPDRGGLRAQAAELVQAAAQPLALDEIARRAVRGQPGGPFRAAAVAASHAELIAELEAATAAPAVAGAPARLLFLCSGQGQHWVGMGRDLLASEPIFAHALRRCDRILRELGGWTVEEELRADAGASRLDRSEVVQPVIVVMQVALAALWESWGVRPDVVIGHSVGEITAAHLAGMLSLEEAIEIVHHRSALMAQIDGLGTMAVLPMSVAEAEQVAARHAGRICVAGSNAPRSTLLSGDAEVIHAVVRELREADVEARVVAIPLASHSHHCDRLLEPLGAALASITPMPPRLEMISSVTASVLERVEVAYWQRNMREPIAFADALAVVLQAGPVSVVELATHPVLSRSASETAQALGIELTVLPTLLRSKASHGVFLRSLAALHLRGHEIRRPGTPARQPQPRLLPLSAHTAAAATQLASEVAAALSEPDADVDGTCAAASALRTGYRFRLAAVGQDADELARRLRAATPVRGRTGGPPPIAMIFSGQGTQWPGMALRLMDEQPVFRAALHRVAAALTAHVSWSLLEELARAGEESQLRRTALAQPAIVALQIALVELWRSWGIEPAAVAGHSVGEITAAHVAGALDLDGALRLAALRGQIMDRAAPGAMVSVALPPEQAQELVSARGAKLSVAAVNGPAATVLAGAREDVEALLQVVELTGMTARVLAVEYAFHSHLMAPLRDELAEELQRLAPTELRIPMASTITGRWCSGPELGPEHWADGVVEPVLMASAIDLLAGAWIEAFIEVGPHPALLGPIRDGLDDSAPVVVGSMRRDAGLAPLLDSLGSLYAAGVEVDWAALQPDVSFARLPELPWQRQPHWIEPGPSDLVVQPRPRTRGDLLYRVAWAPAPAGPAATAGTSVAPTSGTSADSARRWLVTGPGREAIAERLRAAGESCVESGEQELQTALTLDPHAGAPVRVVHVAHDPGASGWREVLAPALTTVRAVAASAAAAQLWLVTRGGRDVGGERPDPPQAAVRGLGRTLALEHPAAWGGALDHDGTPASLDALVGWLCGEGRRGVPGAGGAVDGADGTMDGADGTMDGAAGPVEDEVAFRAGVGYVPRLRAGVARADAISAIHADGSYLITGGLGGVGLHVAAWLAGRGARQLVLIGRRPPDRRARRAIDQLRAAGVMVEVASVDVTSEAELASLFARFDADLPPLRGVVHAAGVLDDGILLQQDAERLARVIEPKLTGALALDRLCAELPLELFILFSSFSAELGAPGQGNYVAANAALDALAGARRTRGLPAISIGWGPWAETGMTAGQKQAQQWQARGVTPLTVRQATAALDAILAAGSGNYSCLSVDWAAYARWAGKERLSALLAELIGEATGAGPEAVGPDGEGGAQARAPGLAETFGAAHPGDRRQLVEDRVAELVADVLGLASGSSLDRETGFFDLGLDSLMMVTIANRLAAQLPATVRVPATVAIDHGSVVDLADFLCGLLARDIQPIETARSEWDEPDRGERETDERDREPDERDRELLAAVEAMSDEEILSLLAAEEGHD